VQVDADVSEKHAVSIFRGWSDKAWKPLIRDIREHKPAPNKNTTPSDEPWKSSFLHSTPSPLPITCLKAPYWSASSSHITSLWLAPFPQPLLFRSYISPLLPCIVTSVPEDGDGMFLRNVGIDLQIHTAPKFKTLMTAWW
jgi:hypothetical protein